MVHSTFRIAIGIVNELVPDKQKDVGAVVHVRILQHLATAPSPKALPLWRVQLASVPAPVSTYTNDGARTFCQLSQKDKHMRWARCCRARHRASTSYLDLIDLSRASALNHNMYRVVAHFRRRTHHCRRSRYGEHAVRVDMRIGSRLPFNWRSRALHRRSPAVAIEASAALRQTAMAGPPFRRIGRKLTKPRATAGRKTSAAFIAELRLSPASSSIRPECRGSASAASRSRDSTLPNKSTVWASSCATPRLI